MTDFSHLKQYAVEASKSVDCVLFQLEGEPSIKMLPASEANKPYFNALLKASRKNIRAIQSKKVNAHTIAENRKEDRILFSKFVATGWKGIVDSKGKEVEFTEVNCLGFFEALPNEIFDELRAFASDVANFINEGISEDAAKNS